MNSSRLVIAGVILAVLAVTAVGTGAFTSAEVTRTTNMDVVNDNASIIALQDGTSGELISLTDGQLTIDFTAGGASGVNQDALYKFGDGSDAVNNHAFSVSNNSDTTRDITVEYTNVANLDGASGAVTFEVYDSSGQSLGTVTPSQSSTVTLDSGETAYVVLTVDTDGVSTTADFSGDLRFSA